MIEEKEMSNNLTNFTLAGLPATPDKLLEFILLSRAKVAGFRSLLAGLDRDGASDTYQRTLAEAQIVAENALWAEARLGEVLAKSSHAGTFRKGGEKTLPDNITKKQSHHAQQLAKHPDFIVQAVASAKARGDLPTRRDVIAATRQAAEGTRKANLERSVDIELPAGIYHGDFYELSRDIPDDSIDLIFTDPPYDADSVPLYEKAAEVAARILKPGGSFVAYSGVKHQADVVVACRKYLIYWWTCIVVHEGGDQLLQKLGIRCGWKPMVWFVKQTRGDVQNVISDIVRGNREKDVHEWQQSVIEARYFIERLSFPDSYVVDFFLGSGTTAVAAKELGRRFIGYEIDAGTIEAAVKRLA